MLVCKRGSHVPWMIIQVCTPYAPSYLSFLHVRIIIVHGYTGSLYVIKSVTDETGTLSHTQNYPAYARSLSLSENVLTYYSDSPLIDICIN